MGKYCWNQLEAWFGFRWALLSAGLKTDPDSTGLVHPVDTLPQSGKASELSEIPLGTFTSDAGKRKHSNTQIAGKTEALSEVSGKSILESGGEGNRWNRDEVVILGRILATVEITKGSK